MPHEDSLVPQYPFPVFNRSKSRTASVAQSASNETSATPGAGKGRPTPTRKEAEAAAKARAKASATGSGVKQSREQRATAAQARRIGVANGDERYLNKRDRGPVRRFARDFADSRFAIAEATIPVMLLGIVLAAFKVGGNFGTVLVDVLILVVILDAIMMWVRLRRQLKRRFPEVRDRGVYFYSFTRSLQLRFLRLPKPQVKIGQKLPDVYK